MKTSEEDDDGYILCWDDLICWNDLIEGMDFSSDDSQQDRDGREPPWGDQYDKIYEDSSSESSSSFCDVEEMITLNDDEEEDLFEEGDDAMDFSDEDSGDDDEIKKHFYAVMMGSSGAGATSTLRKICILSGQVSLVDIKTRRAIYAIDDKVSSSSVRSLMTHVSQADFGVMIISAAYEESIFGPDIFNDLLLQIMLAKHMGLFKIIVAINKMDVPGVHWSRERYEDVNLNLDILLSCFSKAISEDFLICLPISARHGNNINRRVSKGVCSWWHSNKCLFKIMDDITKDIPRRDPEEDPFRMPINYHCGTLVAEARMVMGRIDGGHIQNGDDLLVMPHSVPVKVLEIYDSGEKQIDVAGSGDKIWVKLGGLQHFPAEKLCGSVLSSLERPLSSVTLFSALLFDATGPYKDEHRIAEVGLKGHICIHNFMTNYEIVGLRMLNITKDRIEKLRPGSWEVTRIKVEEAICVELERSNHKGKFITRSDRFVLLGDEEAVVAVGKALPVVYQF